VYEAMPRQVLHSFAGLKSEPDEVFHCRSKHSDVQMSVGCALDFILLRREVIKVNACKNKRP